MCDALKDENWFSTVHGELNQFVRNDVCEGAISSRREVEWSMN